MRQAFRLFTCVALIATSLLLACAAQPVSSPPPDSCDSPTELFSAFAVLSDADHPCRTWVLSVYGRAARQTTASAAVWTTHTEAGTALLVSAMHTLGVGWFEPAGRDIPETVRDPTESIGVPRVFLVTPDGSAVDSLASPLFDLYNPAVPGDENVDFMEHILPRHDFFVAAIDDQKISVSPVVGLADTLHDEPPPLYDPAGRAMVTPAYAGANANELVMMIGFPGSGALVGQLAASVGRVLGDDEADQAIMTLAGAGDEEGDIPYEAEVEMLIEGEAVGGMSGSGIFDADGNLVGVLVRASDPIDGIQYVRAVRMTFISSEMSDAFDALSPDRQAAVAPYVQTLP